MDTLFPDVTFPLSDAEKDRLSISAKLEQANHIVWDWQICGELDEELYRAAAEYLLKHKLYA